MNLRKILTYALIVGSAVLISAQDRIVIEPLFEYPTAPESMDGLQERSEYLLEHFWDKMDFKNKSTVDQNALNDAFSVYSAPMRFADAAKVDVSVQKLLSSISKNPALSLQFAKAAEEALYGPRAYYWNDEIFLRFIDNVLSNKSIKKERKLRYQRIKTQLSNTLQGSVPPEFDYITPGGKTAHYHPNGVITVIEFGDPDCDDCRHAKLRMDTDIRFSTLVDKGKVNVLFIYADPEEGWEEKLKDYPSKWHVGASEEVADLYDIRDTPSIYVIDKEGRVAAKNTDVNTAIAIASAAAEQ
ncbi:MAG: DUF5106 domain-containing protein [Muribaculaceae bacterium]|nr:DUF5106 domain-containing protein [Muribaculaceae bacterium]